MPICQPIPDTVTVPQLAKLSGYTTRAIYYRLYEGKLEAYRSDDGFWRIPMQSVRDLISRQKFSR